MRPVKCGMVSMSPQGSRYFSAINVSMSFLITWAYGIGDDQLVKNSGWIETECYSITARAAGTGTLSYDQLKPLLQNLLAQRFGLTVHSEVKEFSGYALVVAKGGPKLTPTKGGHATGYIRMDGLRAQNIPLTSLAGMLTHAVGGHIIDETGITGRYDINISFVPDASLAPTDSSLPSIFTALPQQLGLKLVSQKVPVKMLYIDHVDKVPTEN